MFALHDVDVSQHIDRYIDQYISIDISIDVRPCVDRCFVGSPVRSKNELLLKFLLTKQFKCRSIRSVNFYASEL